MRKAFIKASMASLGILWFIGMCGAQGYELSDEHKAAMKKLEFLVGNWEGEAWSLMPNQPKETVVQTEKVHWDLNESILIVEGLGKKMDPETKKLEVAHQALAIISYDPQAKKYRFNTFVADGRSSIADAYIKDTGEFIWTTDAGKGYKIRYTIILNESGQWIEKGEWSRDGENWTQFFGMTLDKVK
jgi:hypothetical protein